MAGTTLPLTHDEFSGRVLGKYEVLCRLSMGGMSEIFLAHQKGLAGFRKPVVLKQILPDIRGEEEFVRMFLDEARVTAAFNHPNIAQVYDLDVADEELILVMEFVQGATLVELARACRGAGEAIPIGFTLSAVRDTALALHYAHAFITPSGRTQPVIHRDVAEKNIMVTYEGVTKLLDFGIAKSMGALGRTNVGMVKGTSGYMSPEQILGQPLDARSDLFSLGVVLHECLTGMRLFYGKSAEAGMMAALKEDVAPPSKTNKAVTGDIDAVNLKALARNREDRYPTCLEFARALERAAGNLMWLPEQSGEFMKRLFSDRREQTRALLEEAASERSEMSGEIQLQKLLGNRAFTPPPPLPKPPPFPPARAAAPPAPPPSGPRPTLELPIPEGRSTHTEETTVPPAGEESTADIAPANVRAASEEITGDLAPKSLREANSPDSTRDQQVSSTPRRTSQTALPVRPAASDDASGEVITRRRSPTPRPRSLEEPTSHTPRRAASRKAGFTPAPLPPESLVPWEEELTGRTPTRDESREETRVSTTSGVSPWRAENTDITGEPYTGARAADDEEEDSTQQISQEMLQEMLAPPPSSTVSRPELRAAEEEVTAVKWDPPSRKAVGAPRVEFDDSAEEEDDEYEQYEETRTTSTTHVPSSRKPMWILLSAAVVLFAAVGFATVNDIDPVALLRTYVPMAVGEQPPQPAEVATPAEPEVEAPAVAAGEVKQDPTPTEPVKDPVEVEPAEDAAEPKVVATKEAVRAAAVKTAKSTAAPKRTTPRVVAATSRTATASGQLTLVAQPYAQVSLNGKSLGTTPLFKVAVPAGKHQLKLVGEDGQARTLEIQVEAGETATHRVQLSNLPSN